MSTAPTVTLHGFWRSSATWRVRIALAHKGIAYQYIPVNLRKGIGEQNGPEFAHLNPMRQVPVLEIDDLEGVRDDGFVDDSVRKHGATLRLTQSLAILEYLEERFPAHPLLPPDRNRRARARMIAEVVNSGTQPFQNTSVQQYLDDIIHSDSAAWVRHWVGRGLTALEAMVSESAGRYCVGDDVTFADCCLVPQMYFARRFALDLAACPTLVRVDAACAALPAFQAAHADVQPDRE